MSRYRLIPSPAQEGLQAGEDVNQWVSVPTDQVSAAAAAPMTPASSGRAATVPAGGGRGLRPLNGPCPRRAGENGRTAGEKAVAYVFLAARMADHYHSASEHGIIGRQIETIVAGRFHR